MDLTELDPNSVEEWNRHMVQNRGKSQQPLFTEQHHKTDAGVAHNTYYGSAYFMYQRRVVDETSIYKCITALTHKRS